jgi:hypothetical protein
VLSLWKRPQSRLDQVERCETGRGERPGQGRRPLGKPAVRARHLESRCSQPSPGPVPHASVVSRTLLAHEGHEQNRLIAQLRPECGLRRPSRAPLQLLRSTLQAYKVVECQTTKPEVRVGVLHQGHGRSLSQPVLDRAASSALVPRVGRADVRVLERQNGLVTDEPAPVELSDDERAFLRAALLDWGGPANPTDEVAVALGATDADSLSAHTWGLWKRFEAEGALSTAAWRQVLLAVEVVFVSDVVGSGLDWPITSGFSDADSIRILRGLQRRLPRWRNSVQFSTGDDGSVHLRCGPRSTMPREWRACADSRADGHIH